MDAAEYSYSSSALGYPGEAQLFSGKKALPFNKYQQLFRNNLSVIGVRQGRKKIGAIFSFGEEIIDLRDLLKEL